MAPSSKGPSSPSRSGGAIASGSIDLINERAAVDGFHDQLARAMTNLGYPKASLFAVRLALHEAISNAFHHGHKDLPPGTPIRIEYSIDASHLAVSIEDRGPGFDPADVPDPTLDEYVEATSGRGLMLIRAYMAKAQYSKGGRRLEMDYVRPATPSPKPGKP
jgi:serine/threonine-protein kinase RsbW